MAAARGAVMKTGGRGRRRGGGRLPVAGAPPPPPPPRAGGGAVDCGGGALTGLVRRALPFAVALSIAAAGMAALAPRAEAQVVTPDPLYWSRGGLFNRIDVITPVSLCHGDRAADHRPAGVTAPRVMRWNKHGEAPRSMLVNGPRCRTGRRGTTGPCHGLTKISQTGYLTADVTPNATMIANGGFVFRMNLAWERVTAVRRWVPLHALKSPRLILSANPISEHGGAARVTAAMSSAATAAVTVTVSTAAGAGTTAADFTQEGTKLTIAAGNTTGSMGLVVVAANDDSVHAPNRQVTISASAASGDSGVNASSPVTLRLTEDERKPLAALVLDPASIAESGGESTVTATLSGPSSEAVTLTVATAPVFPATAADFAQAGTTLTIAAGATVSTGTVTVTANDNAGMGNGPVTVSATAAGGNGVDAPPNATLTLIDDETPQATLALSSSSISENGGVATVTATLNQGSANAITLTVSVAAVAPTVAADFTQAGTMLTFAANATASAGLVTVTANDNMAHGPDKSVTVSAADANVFSFTPFPSPPPLTLTLTDDETLPTLTLALDPVTVAENGGLSTVTATLSAESSAAVTVVVTAAAGAGAAAGEFTVGTARRLTIAAGETTSTGLVTVTSLDDDVHQASAGSRVTVAGTVAGGNGVANPAGLTLTRTDDDMLPTVGLVLSEPDPATADAISENGGVSTVTATLTHPTTVAVTVTVSAEAITSTGAVAGDFTQGGATLTIAARATASTGLVTVTGVDNDVDAADKRVRVIGATVPSTRARNPDDAMLTLTNDDDAMATLVLNPAAITENGGISTVTARLSNPATEAATLTVTATAVSPAVPGDFTRTGSTLTVAAGATTSTGLVTVTAVDNSATEGDKQVNVAASASGGRGLAAPAVVALTIRDDEFGLNVGSVSGQATEAGGLATFTVALQTQPSAAVTVAVSSQDTGEGTVSPSSLTFETTDWNTAQTVTVTGVDDDVDDGTVTWAVRLDTASGGDSNYHGLADEDVDVTTTDDDDAPGVTLALDPASVTENGGVATVTARLSRASGAATTLSVTAVSGAFTVGSGAAGVVVIPAGSVTGTDTALVTAVDNTTDAPDRTATVTATVTNARAAADSMTMAVTGATLTLTDDDAAPGVTLALDPASVSENAGVSTVTATLSRPSSEPSTVTVAAASGLYMVGTDATITIAAGSTTAASDTVLITAVDDDIHQGTAGRSAAVTAALTNGHGAGAVTGVALTLSDDETLPTLSLELDPASIPENGGVSTVTAGLSGKSSEAVTVTVAAAPVTSSGAAAGDFNLSTATTLTIAAGSTTSAGTVTVTAVDDTGTTGSIQVTVSGTAAGGNSVLAPADQTLTITDDDTPQATLALSSNSIAENGGVATVTATLDRTSSVAVTVTVTAAAVAASGAVAGDFSLSSPATLTFAASATTSAGLVTVTAVNNTTDAPDKSVTVSGTASDSNNWTNDPPGVTLAITDDDAGPGVTLALNPASIAEPSGVSTVTATLSHPSSEPSTVTVTAVSGAYTAGTDATIVIAAGATTAATDTATIRVVDDDLHHGNAGRSATVTAALTNGQGAGAVTGASLTITDDETLPVASLLFNPLSGSISENGGIATITAQLTGLSGKSSEATTVTVAVAAVASSGAVSGDFTLSSTITLTIAAGSLTSTGLVTVTGVDNNVDAANKLLRVSGTTAGGNGILDPGLAALTLTNDDDATASLVLDPSTILEDRGVSTVTARLSHPTTEAATLTVAATAVSPADAMDFTLSSTTTLTIAANATTSTGLVTVTGVDNNDATGNRQVTVSATAAGGRGVSNPSDATLILRDDEFGLSESAVSGQATEGGDAATFTVRLNTQPMAEVTVAVTSRDAGEGTVSPPSLTFTTGDWSTAQTVTVTGVQDTIDDGTVTWQVRLDTSSSGDSNYNGLDDVNVDVTTTDDDGPPAVTLALSPSSVAENGGLATVTARLSHGSGAATTLTVAAVSGAFTVGSDATIVIPAEATAAPTDTVLVTAVDNTTDEPNRTATVTATAANARAAADSMTMTVTGATLTLEDDESAPGATLALNPASVVENGGIATVTATLSGPSSQPSTVTVTSVAGAYTAGTDATIVIAAGATTAASDTATVAGVDDDVHQGSAGRRVTVTGTLANGQGAGAVTGAALTLTDDETLPTVALVLGPASISENGGVSSVTATLSGPSSAATTVTVAAAAVASTGAVAGDFALSTATTLTIAAGSTTSAGTVTVTGVDNNVDVGTATKSVTVSATAAGGNGVAAPSAVTLTLADDDATATATLVLNPSAISENGGISTVTARLSHPTTQAVTLTVATAAVAPAVAGNFTRAGNALTIAAGSTTSAGLVTVTGVDNNDADGNKRVSVSATASGGHGVSDPSVATLTIRDDEFGLDLVGATGLTVTEAGGTAAFTLALLTRPSAAVTVAVSSRDAGEGTVSPSSLVFTTGNWNTARTVTVTGVDDDVDDGTVTWQVRLDPMSGGDSNYDGIDENVDVTTTDDDDAPGVTLALAPASVTEDGGVSTVTATLSHPSSAATTVTVTASPVSPAVAGDFTLSTAATLTIAAGSISSGGVVTITANHDTVDTPNKTVRVSAMGNPGNSRATADSMTMTVTAATLTIRDIDEKGLAFAVGGDPAATLVAAGGSGSWTAVLTSEPTAAVTVSISTDNDDLTISPSRLTFMPSNWRTAQAVMVTGIAGAAASRLTHRGMGGGYGEVSEDLWVAGSAAGDVETTEGETGTTTTLVNGRPVRRTVVAGDPPVPSGVRIVPPDLPADSQEVTVLEVTFTPLDGGQAAAAVGSGYSVGPEGARVAVDVVVSPVPEGGVRLCLPVTPALWTAAAGRPLILFRRGEQVDSRPVPPSGRATEVCADGVASFSPFALGYEDTKPSFAADAEAYSWDVDEAIDPPEMLPEVTVGDAPIEYALSALSPALPEGVALERDGRRFRLSGTPKAEMGVTDYVWTATDVDGDVAEWKFTIEVVPALDKARARYAAVNRSVLPELSRATWGSVVEAVTGRLESSGAGSGMADTLASALKAREGMQDESGVTWRDVVEGRTFAVALGGGGGGPGGGSGSGADGGVGGGSGSGSSAVVWGGGSRRSLALDKGSLDWSGDLFAAHVGMDALLGEGLRGGLAASWIEGEIEYTDRSGDEAVTGVHVSRLAAVHPYLGWSGADGSRLWGALGYGEGEIEIADTEFVERFGVQKGDSAFVGVAVGGSVPVVSANGLVVSVKGSGEATRYSVDDNGLALSEVSVDTRRVRLAAEARRTWALAGGGAFTPSLEVGARWDGGDGETGAGMELGGGVEWTLPSRGLSVEARGRALVAHQGDVEEWGVSGTARLSPGSGGRGLSLALSPRWGASESGLARLWDEGMTGGASPGAAADADTDTVHLEAEVGYGIGFWEGSGLATPHAGVGYGNDGERRYRLGTRFAFGPDVAVGLQAERKEGTATPEHGAGLELRLRW